jgi:CTP synthase (UTP-ammonia lyase)
MITAPRIAIVGDHVPTMDTHRAIDEALRHVTAAHHLSVEWSWVGTTQVAAAPDAMLSGVDGVWLAPGSPYASMDGALDSVRFVRERGVPFLGVCGGFQHALIEYARNVAGITGADHAESTPGAPVALIAPLACSMIGKSGSIFLDPTCRTAAIYGRWRVVEQYHCQYGLNPDFRAALESAGLHVVGEDDHADARVVELPGHPFFIATLFQPQLTSTAESPAPLVRGFVDAAAHFRAARNGAERHQRANAKA